ncbi:MAG TPA: hypothetical protein VES40_15935, partial [Ilumatobacteraceae bacterium]|nr:hypothetical protein [Ilumatobacteraceae bacterium]
STRDDPTSITGSPSELAEALRALAATHRPDVLGIALVDGDPIGSMMEHAVAALDLLTRPEVNSRG